ncbi:T9SS type A sorting domain-containing protein [Pseudochryseolinea flava]|uniref:Secretion system C-terminal sorting domain-containing protein n=1 Tax=Pseudochryseolinea flava TaxID=2059302 RepID=A0A364XW72_9BACT|nr:T9SS type A sorting domain-containing protein [Pseudochryseolinea flava]RAV98201.1 hypothetical protein DQQ10_24665 [Pseudochryseolinea flava]
MKKLLLFVVVHLLPICVFAQIKIGDTTYDLLTDAIGASVSGDVIEISGPVVLTEQVGLAHATGVKTFKGTTADASITLATGARFILEAAGETVFEDLTLIGADQAHEDWGAMLTLFNGPTLILRNDTLRGAKTNAHAGAMRITSGATVEAYATVFMDNEANQNGGVAFIEAGNTETLFDKCVFLNNKAGANSLDAKGGALFYAYGSNMKDHIVKNSAFINNTSSNHGGVIGLESVSPIFVNCTFSGNTTVDNGGVFWMYNSAAACTTTLVNCTFYGNSAGNGDALFMNHTTTQYDIRNSVFTEHEGVTISSAETPATLAITNSYFPTLPEGLTVNGGTKNIHEGDLLLAELNVEEGIVWHEVTTWRSAAVGLGNPNLLRLYSNTDQTGEARNLTASSITAGAFEYRGLGPVLNTEKDIALITVHPNPATEYILIAAPERVKLTIYNSTGQLLYKRNLSVGEHRIETSTFGKSMLIVKAQDDRRTTYAKILVK